MVVWGKVYKYIRCIIFSLRETIMKLLLIGHIEKDVNRIMNASMYLTHFLYNEFKKLDEEIEITNHPQKIEGKYDYIMNLSPIGINRMNPHFDTVRKHGKTVLFLEIDLKTKPYDYRIVFSPRNIADCDEVPTDSLIEQDDVAFGYPFSPKRYFYDETVVGKFFIDNKRNRNMAAKNNTKELYGYLEKAAKEYDLTIYQETDSNNRPEHIQLIKQDDSHKIPWLEYIKHIRETMVHIPTDKESYGYDRVNTVCGLGQIIQKNSVCRGFFRDEFKNHIYKDEESFLRCVNMAYKRYDENKQTLENIRNKIWSIEKTTKIVYEYLNDKL